MPRVYNIYHGHVPIQAVDVRRPSEWANPYSHIPETSAQKVGTREEAVARYHQDVMADDTFRARVVTELRGKDLVCCCAPKSCHADVLLAVANDLPYTPPRYLKSRFQS